ncbi:hypothetical protein BB561_006594, partial [Smittium simulii]
MSFKLHSSDSLTEFEHIGSSIKFIDQWDIQPAKEAKLLCDFEDRKDRNSIVVCRNCQNLNSQKENLINYKGALRPTFKCKFCQTSTKKTNPTSTKKPVTETETLQSLAKKTNLISVTVSGFDTEYVSNSKKFLRKCSIHPTMMYDAINKTIGTFEFMASENKTIEFKRRLITLKKVSYKGSDKKIGCSWTQFSGNINAAIDYVALKIDDEYVLYQHDSRAKATYFMFYNEERAEKCMNTPIYYNGIAVELYQTVTLEEGTHIITILSTNSINIRYVVEAVNNTFTKNGIIYDFSAYKNKISGKFHTFGVKFLFKKTIYSFEIPTFLEIDKF